MAVYNGGHPLSEEVCIKESIPLNYAVALVLPYETPMSKLISIQKYFIHATCGRYALLEKKKYRYELQKILKNPKRAILASYEEVLKYQKLLDKYQANIPCITYNNYSYNCEEELNNIPYILNRAQFFYDKIEKK